MVAELLGYGQVNVVTHVEAGDGKLTAHREIEGAEEIIEASMPAVITAQKGLNEPRYASLKGIMAAKKIPIETKSIADLGLDMHGVSIVDPSTSPQRERYIQELFRLRQRRGMTLSEAKCQIANRNVFGSMMLHAGDADALVSGVTQHFPDTIRPALEIVRVREGLHKVSGCYAMITRKGDIYFLADTSVNIEPTAEDLVEIALCAAQTARRFDVEPRVAMLSFSSFGSTKHPQSEKVRRAVELLHRADPTLMADGELMADDAVSADLEQIYPFSFLKGGANVLIFPDLASANITYKLLQKLGGGETLGPILMGMSKPVHLLTRGSEVEEIVNVTAIAVVDAQESGPPMEVPEAEPVPMALETL